MKNKILLFTCINLSSFGVLPLANAEPSHADKSFLEKAAKSGLDEVAISEAVSDRLTNSDVKSFAQMMVANHGRANMELTALASQKGVILPVKDKEVVDLKEKWSKKSNSAD